MISINFKKIGKLFLFNLVIFSALLIGIEVVLEFVIPEIKGNSSVISRCIPLREAGLPNSKIKVLPTPHDILTSDNLTNKPYFLEIDTDGYIKSKNVNKSPRYKVVFLGGSTTQCRLVSDSIRFPSLVGEMLNDDNISVNTYNAGESGNHSVNSINTLVNKVVFSDFDIAILMHNINDLTTLMYFRNYYSKDENFSRKLITTVYVPEKTNNSVAVLESQNIFYRTKKAFQIIFPNTYGILYRLNYFAKANVEKMDFENMKMNLPQKAQYDQFRKSLSTFVAISEANGILPILMTQFNRISEKELATNPAFAYYVKKLNNSDIPVSDFCSAYNKMNDIVREVAGKNDVMLIDLDKEILKSKDNMYDMVHLTDEGSEKVAKIIYEKLKFLN